MAKKRVEFTYPSKLVLGWRVVTKVADKNVTKNLLISKLKDLIGDFDFSKNIALLKIVCYVDTDLTITSIKPSEQGPRISARHGYYRSTYDFKLFDQYFADNSYKDCPFKFTKVDFTKAELIGKTSSDRLNKYVLTFALTPIVRVKHTQIKNFRQTDAIYVINNAKAIVRHKGAMSNPDSDVKFDIKCSVNCLKYYYSSLGNSVAYDPETNRIGNLDIDKFVNKDEFLKWVATIG